MSKRHVVKRGECLTTIAHQYGFHDPGLIHNHPDNADFKLKRPDPNLLFPDDEIAIPDFEPKTILLATGQRHTIVVKRQPRHLKLRLIDFDRAAYKGQPYKLFIDDNLTKEDVATDGQISMPVPIAARKARLEVGDYRWQIDLGDLNPIQQTDDQGASGILGRLYGLGYHVELDGDDLLLAPKTRAAIRWFQRDHGLDPTGELTEDTTAAIIAAFGC